jgi:hypothetical protein
LLHDVVICVAVPAFPVSPRDGQLRGLRADGFYNRDRRLLHTLCLLIDDREPEPIGIRGTVPTIRPSSSSAYGSRVRARP